MITLHELQQLANTLAAAQRDVLNLEEQLKNAKERARFLAEESLPCAMQEIGMKSFRLASGEEVSVKQDVYASIPTANKQQAFEWLEEHDFGGLIKSEISVQFGRDSLVQAMELRSQLLSQNLNPEFSRNVHPQTLKAFLREQLEKGSELPLELFGARPVFVAEIKTKKGG